MSAHGISSYLGTRLKTSPKMHSKLGQTGWEGIRWKPRENEFEVPFWGATTVLCLNKNWVSWIWAFVNYFSNATHMSHTFSCMQIPLGWKGYVSQWTLLTASTLDHSPRPGSSVYLCVHLQPRHHHISPWLRSYIPSHVSTFDTDLNTPPLYSFRQLPTAVRTKSKLSSMTLALWLCQEKVLVY